MANIVEILVRGVYIIEDRILLCKTKGNDITYLPGGHIDFGESAVESLKREIKEETGYNADVLRFLGVVEHTFIQKGERHCEINLVFEIKIDGLTPSIIPRSCEEWLEFMWSDLKSLKENKLEPVVLCEVIDRWLKMDVSQVWASTYYRCNSSYV